MYVYIYIYRERERYNAYIIHCTLEQLGRGRPAGRASPGRSSFFAPNASVRDFTDTACPFFESDTLFLECVLVLVLVV